jgi:site-specific DNA-methyltransferase (adenine-specific)
MMRRELHFGDNLEVLRDTKVFADESVNLVYLDPPFNSNASYNMLFKDKKGDNSEASITAFDDTWHWGLQAEMAFDEVVRGGNIRAAQLLISP